MDSLVLDTVVGIVFVFAVFAFAVSGFVEGMSRLVGLRAEFLLRGVSSLLDENTKFDKNWIPNLVKSAEEIQDAATSTAIADAQKQSSDANTDVPARAEIDAALTKAAAVVSPYAELAAAEKAIQTAADSNATTAAIANRDAAQATLDRRKEDNTAQTALDEAAETLKDADEALTAVADAINANPPPADAAAQKTKLDKARKLLAPARQAQKYTPTSQHAVTVVSIMTQPVVDLTAALKIPDRIKGAQVKQEGRNGHGQKAKNPSWRAKWKLPSYLSARTFSSALIHTLVPDPATGQTTVTELRGAIDTVSNPKLKRVLAGHLDAAEKKVDSFRLEIEKWYDDHMDRVSGWYKRHTRWYVLGVGAVLAVGFNINAVAMSQAFYSDQALRESVVKLAFDTAGCQAKAEDTTQTTTGSAPTPGNAPSSTSSPPATPSPGSTGGQGTPTITDTKTAAQCLDDVRAKIDGLHGAGLPIGWGQVAACKVPHKACNWSDDIGLTSPSHDSFWPDVGHLVLVLLGWLVVAVSALMGARFWFGLLTKLGSIRSAGTKPEKSKSGG